MIWLMMVVVASVTVIAATTLAELNAFCAFVKETTKHCVYCQLSKCHVEWANAVFSVQPLLTVEMVRAFIVSVELCALVVRFNGFILKIHFEMQ